MRRILIIATALAVLAGCQSIPSGATAYSTDEIKAQLSGRTWTWPGGDGVYFAHDGSSILKWKGKRYQTNWTAEPGKFCNVTEDGPFCWQYYKKDGKSWAQSLQGDGDRAPYEWQANADTKSGNQL
ncbi:membrane lipoprotein lipid attachment site-containing protein [Hoeflea sp. Naph1]|uniref:membrane lipoprotein lipid attachment site-containing protein n=1 Tax=Hoeflea sp. Naph1 TaxID=3388653 RepID=UPI00398FAE57